VNIPSSVEDSPTSSIPATFSSGPVPRTAPDKPQSTLKDTISSNVAPERLAPKKAVETPVSPRPAEQPDPVLPPKQQARPRATEKAVPASKALPALSIGRPRRTCAVQALQAIQEQTSGTSVGSDISEPDVTPEQPRRVATAQDQAGINDALPTPPRTRSTKLAAKTLVPSTPVVNKALQPVSSPISELPSPTSKVISKRKRDEDDPIEPLVTTQERQAKQQKTIQVEAVLPSSQYIVPRSTAAARVKTKYTAHAKKMRVMSPDSIPSVDIEDVDLPVRKEVLVREESLPPGSEPIEEDMAPPPKESTRSTRSTVAPKKSRVPLNAIPSTASETSQSAQSTKLDDPVEKEKGSGSILPKGYKVRLYAHFFSARF
jgi:hypothetical protein